MRPPIRYNILNAKATTGFGNAIRIEDYRHAVLGVATDNSADLTIKIQAATALITTDPSSFTAPDFTAAASVTNAWDYVEVVDREDGNAIDGDTGIVIAADEVRFFALNTDLTDFINVEVSSRTAGDVTVWIAIAGD